MTMITKKHLKRLSLSLLLIFLVGCGIWTNFTTYFNLYFNATQLYEEAQLEIEKLNKDPFLLNEPEATGGLKETLTNLQEKASRILQHESESAYFEDALFLSGYAFYYSGNYLKANRKFQELASQNDEDYNLKSRLWIAKCELQVRNFDDGVRILENVKDSALVKEDEDILEETYRVLIAYHIDRQEYSRAIDEGYKLIEVSDNDELRAQVAYKIGMLQLEQGNEEEAAKAFESVLDYSPNFEIEFQSKFELAKLKKDLGKIAESREMFEDLYNEGKYSEFWGDVYYQLGLIEYESENYDKAFSIFQDVDELYSNSLGAVQSKLMLGELMRTVYADYDSAKTYYDAVKSNNKDPEIKELANVYSQSINSYLNYKNDIKQTKRQITYLEEPTEFLRDSVAFQKYLATVKEDENQQQQNNFRNPRQKTNPNLPEPQDTTETSDSTETSKQDSLFANIDMNLDFDEDYVVTEKPVYPKVGVDSLESRIAKDYFELGNLFFTDLNRPDSAYHYYDLLLETYPSTKYKPRVLFALGAYYESFDDTIKSDSLYSIVYNDYKTYAIANEAAQKLGKPPLITEADPAKAEYLVAEKQIENSNFNEAISTLKEITNQYSESIYVPKSLYTIGWIYENKINNPDSAYNYYSRIMDSYRNSEYANAVRRKVSLYQTELEKLQEEKEKETESGTTESTEISDSLSTEQQQLSVSDSVNVESQKSLADSLSTPAEKDTTQPRRR